VSIFSGVALTRLFDGSTWTLFCELDGCHVWPLWRFCDRGEWDKSRRAVLGGPFLRCDGVGFGPVFGRNPGRDCGRAVRDGAGGFWLLSRGVMGSSLG